MVLEGYIVNKFILLSIISNNLRLKPNINVLEFSPFIPTTQELNAILCRYLLIKLL